MPENIPKVFISYSHDSPQHKRWVAETASKLVDNGVDVFLDQWDLGLGTDIPKYVERSVSEADRVLMICTEQYVRKADEGKGGVGYEAMIVTAELVHNLGTSKFIPVIRQASGEVILPKFIGYRFYANLSEGQKGKEEFENLLRELHKVPALTKPPLGKNPFAKTPSGGETPKEIPKNIHIPNIKAVNDDAAATYRVALEIARQGDLIAWRKIIREAKQPILQKLQNWRATEDKAPPKTKEELLSASVAGISAYAPLFGIALAGVESGRAEFNSQTAILDDILNPAGWNYAGFDRLVSFPLSAAYVYQALYGTMCMLTGQSEIVKKFAESKIKIPNGGRTITLYKYHPVIGWPPISDDNCITGWSFLSSLPEKWAWLKEPFGEPLEYKAALCAYYMILNILEFVDAIVSAKEEIILQQEKRLDLDIPPCFLQEPDEVLNKAYMLLLSNPDKIKAIWLRSGIEEKKIEKLWPYWMHHVQKLFFDIYHQPLFKNDIIISNLINDLS